MIHVENVGPIEQLAIKLSPGVTVLRGRNGSGKSTAIRAARAVVVRDARHLERRDGTKAGKVEGLGCKITIGHRRKIDGELEVMSIENRLELSQLVDPGFSDPLAADRTRIQTLIAMSGRKVEPQAFWSCVDGTRETFELLVSARTLETTEPLELAQRVKRDLEERARQLEDESEKLLSEAAGIRHHYADVDTSGEHDADVLQHRLEEAIHRHAEVKTRVEQATIGRQRRQQAMERQQQLLAARQQTKEQANAKVESARDRFVAQHERVQRLEEELREARNAVRLAEQAYDAAVDAFRAAEDVERQLAELEQIIRSTTDAELPDNPEELQHAAGAVQVAREAIERGVIIRKAVESRRRAEELQDKASERRRYAEALRAGAKQTEVVLASLLPDCGLRVSEGRLVLHTSRGETYFSDLSHGEKWALAVQVAQQLGGEEAFLTIDQEAWESLDHENRATIARRAKELGAVILTAEADHDSERSGPLRAEPYEEE